MERKPEVGVVKGETDTAGLRLMPGCERQATRMVTLPVVSEVVPGVYRNGIPMENQSPR